jgi:Helix-hairpin-helix domain
MPRAAAASARAVPPRAPARPVENIDIARIFEEIADLLEIEGENPFRIRGVPRVDKLRSALRR